MGLGATMEYDAPGGWGGGGGGACGVGRRASTAARKAGASGELLVRTGGAGSRQVHDLDGLDTGSRIVCPLPRTAGRRVHWPKRRREAVQQRRPVASSGSPPRHVAAGGQPRVRGDSRPGHGVNRKRPLRVPPGATELSGSVASLLV